MNIVDLLTDEQKEFFSGLINQVLPQIGQSAPVYPGEIAPGASPLQQQAFSTLGGAFQGESGAAISRLLSGDPAVSDDLYAAEKSSQMSQLQDTFKMIEERANFAGGTGRSGGLQRSMTQAAGDTHLGLGRFQSGLSYAGGEAAAQRQVAGLGAYGSLIGAQLGAGQMQRNIAGQQNAEGYNKWLAAQPYSNPWLGFSPQILGTQTKTPVVTTTGGGVFSG
jgi:hypothetical protein